MELVMGINEITGDTIVTKTKSSTFDENFDNIFRKEKNYFCKYCQKYHDHQVIYKQSKRCQSCADKARANTK
jgi:hypothetical protein